jgi:hypothetical protein
VSLVARAVVHARGIVAERPFERTTRDFRGAQLALLDELCAKNANTAFGLAHGFRKVRGLEHYRASVPIAEYEQYRPWIERLLAGEANLLTHEAPFMFTSTSGTTGQPKLIPVTEAWKEELAAIMRLWIHRASLDHPKMLARKIVSIVSPAVEGYARSGLPIGSMSGLTYQRVPAAARRNYAIPYAVMTVAAYDLRYWLALRLAIEADVSLAVVPNASTIVKLGELAVDHAEEVLRAIHDGVVGFPGTVHEAMRAQIAGVERRLARNPRRARTLERAAAKRGSLRLEDAWPHLALVSSWLGGSAGQTVHRLRRHVGERVVLRDLGLRASEGTFTVPLEDGTPAGVVTGHANLFEFVPIAELESERPRALLGHELEVGHEYDLVVSHRSGLYRYDMNDIVRCEGFHGTAPIIAFVRKGRDMVNVTGEKLHVNHALAAEAAVRGAHGVELRQFRLVPDAPGLRYDLLVELEGGEQEADDDALVAFLEAFDEALARENDEYRAKRKSKRLLVPRLCVMERGWSEAQRRADIAGGKRDGQYKWPVFRAGWDEASQAAVVHVIDRAKRRSSSRNLKAAGRA